MRIIDTPIFWFLIAAQIGLLLLLPFLGEKGLFVVAAIGLVSIGIPHGANDVLHKNFTPYKNIPIFIGVYLMIIAGYAALWYAIPVVALGIFLLISIMHFGQTIFETKNWYNLKPLLWGILFILLPIGFHTQEAFALFAEMTHTRSESNASVVLWTICAILFVGFLYRLVTTESKSIQLKIIIQWVLLFLWLYLTPLLEGFLIAFVLWHATPSLLQQKDVFLKNHPEKQKLFWINMMVYTIIAAVFLLAAGHFFSLTPSMLFILLSLITLPHALVIHQTMPENHSAAQQ
jgi:beta-carotene 15,15'-dioxygenase